MTNLIIGCCSNYEWKDVKNWINSIRQSGYKDDVALVGTNLKKETLDKLTSEGIIVKAYGTKNERGDIVSSQSDAPHVQRFFFLWEFLEHVQQSYGYVITTDTRDVIFQTNPFDWIKSNIFQKSLVASSEGMSYKDEPWGNTNLKETFGEYFHSHLKRNMIFNVGTIAGEYYAIKSLMLMIYQLSLNRPVKIVDQAVYNFILNDTMYYDQTLFTTNESAWAIQLGTTIHAVKDVGAGDLGLKFKHIETAKDYGYKDTTPLIEYETGLIYNNEGILYNIVHQYDRVPKLKSIIDKRYGDSDNDISKSRITFN